jgi:hypothetical protein
VDEEARAAEYRNQIGRRKLAIDAREKMLEGDPNAKAALVEGYSAIRNAGVELAPEGEYNGRFPDQHN